MDNAIAQTSDGSPVDVRPQKLLILGDAIGRLADDFEIADHGIHRACISAECLEIHAAGVSGDLGARLLHVGDKQRPVTAR